MRTLKAMEFANDRNAKVITVTDSSDCVLLPYLAPIFCTELILFCTQSSRSRWNSG